VCIFFASKNIDLKARGTQHNKYYINCNKKNKKKKQQEKNKKTTIKKKKNTTLSFFLSHGRSR